MEIHPDLESAFVILNVLHSMCCNSCFKACQVCLQKHHPWSKQDNQSNPVKRQGRKNSKYRMVGFCRGNLDSLITQCCFSGEIFASIPFPTPASYPQINGAAPLPSHAYPFPTQTFECSFSVKHVQ